MRGQKQHVLVTGGAGYVGSALVPALLRQGYQVTVLDRYFYGEGALAAVRGNPGLRELSGDIRNTNLVKRALESVDSVIHLACISNDPSYDLDPDLGRSINFDAFRPLVCAARAGGVRRFIYASSSSVYGVKEEAAVTEELPLAPLTDYSRFKALCEAVLAEERAPGFVTVTVRPSTVCGYAPRLRLDLVVNILTNQAVHQGRIQVLGGSQMRPNIHIEDMVEVYLRLLAAPSEKVDGQIFNAGGANHTVRQLAEIVRETLRPDLPVEVVASNDQRSYHVSSRKLKETLDFVARRTVADAVRDLERAFNAGLVIDPLGNSLYFNIKRMQELHVR